MTEQYFWRILDLSLADGRSVGSLEQDEFLCQMMEQKSSKELVSFQTYLLHLRDKIKLPQTKAPAEQLGYGGSQEIYNRYCNGLIASGKTFYDKVINEPNFLKQQFEIDPIILRACYYESFSLIAQGTYYEQTDYKGDWDAYYNRTKKEIEANSLPLGKDKTQTRLAELEPQIEEGKDRYREH